MGKAFLTLEELQQFPTLQKLMDGSDGEDTTSWGMCINNDGDISFGLDSPFWSLLVDLDTLIEQAILHCGNGYKADDLLLFYGVDYPEATNISFKFFPLSTYEEKIQKPHQLRWVGVRN